MINATFVALCKTKRINLLEDCINLGYISAGVPVRHSLLFYSTISIMHNEKYCDRDRMYCDKRSPMSLKAAVAFNFDQLLT